jgi:hypothetical protein
MWAMMLKFRIRSIGTPEVGVEAGKSRVVIVMFKV